jgi:hypothetical protein
MGGDEGGRPSGTESSAADQPAMTGSPGARRYYDAHRARGATHHQALRALANRLVGILHGCLRHRQPYNEQLAWPTPTAAAAA